MQTSTIDTWMSETAEAVRQERDYLTQLDAAIGDGDHGTNMDRGFTAVGKALEKLQQDFDRLSKDVEERLKNVR